LHHLKYLIKSVFNINPVTYQELIQNADDAGASRVVFIHDERHYETQSLWTEELGKYQGICVVNTGSRFKSDLNFLKLL